jgi:hypothetical protein
MKISRNEEGEVLEEQALFSDQFKGKCQNRGQVDHKSFHYKNRSNHNGGYNENRTGTNFCSYCRKPGDDKKSRLNLRRRKLKTAIPVILTVTLTGETTSHKMWFSRRLRRTRS